MRQFYRVILAAGLSAMAMIIQAPAVWAGDTPVTSGVNSAPDVYRVGPGDRLKISVYNAEKLSGEYPIGGDGKIAFPMLGRVPVSGLTLDGVADLVSLRLRDGYMQSPSVTVDMASYRSVFILGEVDKPGQYPYLEGMTVMQLVAQAGGFTYRANRSTIKLRGEGEEAEAKYRMSSSAPIRPGDTVVIMQRYF